MKYRLIIKPEAEQDILKVAKWYEDRNEGLGIEFLHEMEKKLNLIEQAPLNYQIRYKQVRFGLINRFPCSIQIFLEEECIYILAVFSTAEDPSLWR
jgi:toxin ParE1/3/4